MTTNEEFREFAHTMVDYVADYLKDIRYRRVLPKVQPGYLQELIPNEAPETGDEWKDVMTDIERVIMPGVTHWHHPSFMAYFQCGASYPAIVAEILSNGIGCAGFNWIASPAATELEMAVMNWLGKMLQLPENFLFGPNSPGGGIIQGSASESTLVALLAARTRAIKRFVLFK